MMCGCGGSSQGRAAPVNAFSSPRGNAGADAFVPLGYQGARALLIRGPATGAGYACYPGETIRVHRADAPHLLASGAFVRAG